MVDAHETDDSDTLTGPLPPTLVGFLLIVVVGGIVDLVFDKPTSVFSMHVAVELGMVLLSLSFAVLIFRRWRRSTVALRRTEATLAVTTQALAERQAERDAWRANAESALAGFGAAIDMQFGAWRLTPAEREVALLLLKGLGHKQVAAQLGRSART